VAIAVVRAETFYTPPPSMPADAWAGVPAAELVWKWYETRMGRRVVPPKGQVDDTYFARINQNRWIGDCSSCGSAQVISPTDQVRVHRVQLGLVRGHLPRGRRRRGGQPDGPEARHAELVERRRPEQPQPAARADPGPRTDG
jgi:hypothetical protein